MELVFSTLMQRKTTVERFRLPYTARQAYAMLYAACRAEVASRHRVFRDTEAYNGHLRDIAGWLTGSEPTFGLFLCGGAGNGKTTILKALKGLLSLLREGEGGGRSSRDGLPVKGFTLVTAKELVSLAKAYNNPTSDNKGNADRYRRARNIEILAIDDLGTEPRESIHYGDSVTAAMDILLYRYEQQFCTLVSSNLAANEVARYYDERIADRFREMMHIVNFGTEPSFRTPQG